MAKSFASFVIIILVIIAAAVFITTGSRTTVPAPLKTADVSSATGQVKEFTVVGQNYSFTPSTITVNKGDHVKITFKNVDGFHDFRIDEFQAATRRISAGQEDAVEFTADKTGTFEYYCSVGGHRMMGMRGSLIVQ